MIADENKTIWCGNLAEKVTEELLYELFLQAGPLQRVKIPRDRDGRQKNFAFITYCHDVSVPYALRLFQGTALFHRKLTLQERGKTIPLPPPIRYYGPDISFDLRDQGNISKQFIDMTDKLQVETPVPIHIPTQRHEHNDKLVMASLQGNWSHRHHPYKSKEKSSNRDNYRHSSQDNYNNSRNWRSNRSFRTRRRD